MLQSTDPERQSNKGVDLSGEERRICLGKGNRINVMGGLGGGGDGSRRYLVGGGRRKYQKKLLEFGGAF